MPPAPLAPCVAEPPVRSVCSTPLRSPLRPASAASASAQAHVTSEVIPWYTLTDDFDADFGVDQWHGTNAFIREGDRTFSTYFVHDRGDEHLGSTWSYLDITALGRREER